MPQINQEEITHRKENHATSLANSLLLANPTCKRESDIATSRIADNNDFFWRDVLAKDEVAIYGSGILESGREGIGKKAILDGCEGSERSAAGSEDRCNLISVP